VTRTDDEIVERIKELEKEDIFGWETCDLLECLPFNVAKQFLKEDAEEDKWPNAPRDRESVLARMLDYMPFAWDKANNCRGISASRSLSHYRAWLWLLGDDLWKSLFDDYRYYGKPQLVQICERFGWDPSQWDDGVRTNS